MNGSRKKNVIAIGSLDSGVSMNCTLDQLSELLPPV